MPSVEYAKTALVYEEQTETAEDPDTGEQVTVTRKITKHPFEIRISKWLQEGDTYQLHGFVEVTDFGQELASQSDPYGWLTDTYQTASGVGESLVGQWVQGVAAVENTELSVILDFGDISPVSATVTADAAMRMDFQICLTGPTTFNIEWLSVDFDPSRSDT
jgi:hypothetical protein